MTSKGISIHHLHGNMQGYQHQLHDHQRHPPIKCRHPPYQSRCNVTTARVTSGFPSWHIQLHHHHGLLCLHQAIINRTKGLHGHHQQEPASSDTMGSTIIIQHHHIIRYHVLHHHHPTPSRDSSMPYKYAVSTTRVTYKRHGFQHLLLASMTINGEWSTISPFVIDDNNSYYP